MLKKTLRNKSGNKITDTKGIFSEVSNPCFLVADRTKGRIYLETSSGTLKLIKTLRNPKGKIQERNLISSKPGRSYSSAASGTIHHAFEGKLTHHQKAALDFSKRLGKTLELENNRKKISEVTLIAEPHFLGLIRKNLPPSISKLVRRELNRDFSHIPEPDLENKIRDAIQNLNSQY